MTFAGEAHFLFVGLVSWSWRRYLDGNKNTGDSEVVMSVSRITEALDSGWKAGNSGWKCAAAVGSMEVVEVLLERYNSGGVISRGTEWETFGERGEYDTGERGVWGDGIFAAGAASGNDEVLKLLLVEGCNKDGMGVKALEVAVSSGRPDVVECCHTSDLGRDACGNILVEQFAAAENIATPPLKLALAARHREMIGPLCRFVGEGGYWLESQVEQYAKDGDLEMIQSLKEMIMCDDGRHDRLFNSTFCTALENGRFSVLSYLLTWWWTDRTPGQGAETDGESLVPNAVLFAAARLGHLKMLQWCHTNCPVVCLGFNFCEVCASADGWSRVLPDAAGAGHVPLVLWCLDNGWGYSDSVMEAAANEGRSNVIVALAERGFPCRVQVKKAAPLDVAGHPSFVRSLCTPGLPHCEGACC